jgi:hypothetical protein
MKTRQLILTGIMTLGLTSVIFAKGDGENKGGFGIKGGVGLSTISFENQNNSKNTWKVGGMLGVGYEARIGKAFALDFEALLANKGVKSEESYSILGNNGNVIVKTNLYTFEIPVSAKIYLGDHFNIYAGPYFSYTLGANYKIDATLGNKSQTKESRNFFDKDYKDANGELPMNRFDVGANIGLEFVSDGGIGVGARFQKGFRDITNDKYKGSVTEQDGYIFPADDKFVTNTGFQVYGIFRF